MVKIAVAQYEIEQLPHWNAYEDKIVRLIEQAKEQNAELLALSEYAGLELASWTENNSQKQLQFVQTILDQYIELFSSLAKKYQLYIQPGTIPVKDTDGLYRNRAFLFSDTGEFSYQDKLFLTRFELNSKFISPGNELRLFETKFGKIGIMICYDSEFPALTKQLVSAGANLILVPSCTEKFSGLTRVVISCRARAIENQCYIAQSSLIGKASWGEFVDINTGQSGIFGPADQGFPEDGIIAQASLNLPMMIHAELSWDKLAKVREHGEMLNYQDTQRDTSPILQSINTIKI